MTTHAEESSDRLTCKFINYIEGTWTVGCSCVVAKIKEIILRQQLTHSVQYCQTAITGIKYSDWTCI